MNTDIVIGFQTLIGICYSITAIAIAVCYCCYVMYVRGK